MTMERTREAYFAALREFAPEGEISTEDFRMLDSVARRWALPERILRPHDARRVSPAGLALIKESEGLRLQAYRCPADVPTIGYGSTGPHVRMGMKINEAEAEALLRKDLDRFERKVAKLAPGCTQGQFDALVSFAFNVGERALEESTLLKLHRAGDFAGAAAQFARWNKAGGKVLPGLVTRRAAEAALYGGKA